MGACAECQWNCVLVHGQHNLNPVVTSFFKVMISDEFLETLFLPPTFARTVSHLVDQEIDLKDSIGFQSKATISKCNGSLAIEQGWRQFSLDHNVETGDFLVFYLITRPVRHFVVHIYGRSGCLKTNFDAPTDRSNKRARTINSLPVQDEPADINSMNQESSATTGVGNSHQQPLAIACTPIIDVDNGRQQSSPPAMHLEEPFFMNDQDTGYNQEENRVFLYDLSRFEMPAIRPAEGNNNCLKGENGPFDLVQQDVQWEKDTSSLNDFVFPTKKNTNHFLGRTQITREECSGTSHFAEKMKSQEKKPMQMRAQGVILPRSQMPASRPAERKSIFVGDREAIEHVQSELNSVKDKSPTKSIMPCKNKMGTCTDSFQITRAECGGALDLDEEMRVIKEEPMEMVTEGKELDMTNKCRKMFKSEPVDSADTSALAVASKDSCLVLVDGRDFLELPDCWPKKGSIGKKIIFLKDPRKRVWPALYHANKQFRALAGGWKEFSVVNRLKPEDKCVFQAEKFGEYSVDIRRKEDGKGINMHDFDLRNRHLKVLANGQEEFCAANGIMPAYECVFLGEKQNR